MIYRCIKTRTLTLANLSAVTLLQDDLCSPAAPPPLSHSTSLPLSASWGFGCGAQCHRLHRVGPDPPPSLSLRKPVLAARPAHPNHPWPAHDSITSPAHDRSVLGLFFFVFFKIMVLKKIFSSNCSVISLTWIIYDDNIQIWIFFLKMILELSFKPQSAVAPTKVPSMFIFCLGLKRRQRQFVWQIVHSITSGTSSKATYQTTEEVETCRGTRV